MRILFQSIKSMVLIIPLQDIYKKIEYAHNTLNVLYSEMRGNHSNHLY